MLWVQSPTGIPATHDSCIGSGGRNRTCVGCVQSAAGMPATHTRVVGGPVRSYTLLPGFGDPYLATKTDPNWRKAVGLDPHIRQDATRFRGEGAPRALHLPMLAEAERVERSRPFRIYVGFKPTKHAACEPPGWRRVDHSQMVARAPRRRPASP